MAFALLETSNNGVFGAVVRGLQAALLRAQEVEQRLSLYLLPTEVFDAFKAAVEALGQVVPGLARAAEASKGRLKDAG